MKKRAPTKSREAESRTMKGGSRPHVGSGLEDTREMRARISELIVEHAHNKKNDEVRDRPCVRECSLSSLTSDSDHERGDLKSPVDAPGTRVEMHYNPYNANNTEITLDEVQSILTRYGVPAKVRNLNLYQRAFVHKSYTKKPGHYNNEHNITVANCPPGHLPLRTKSNERLEFVGDGVLECITKYYMYRRFPKEDEGFMTEKKIALVKNEHIGRLAIEMGLPRWFIMSKNAEEKNTRCNVNKLGCLFEAFLGALFLDFNGMPLRDENNFFEDIFVCGPGFQIAQIFLENVFDTHVNWSNIVHLQDNYKNLLQVKIQRIFKVTPHYIMLKTQPEFEMGIFIFLGNVDRSRCESDPKRAIPFEQFGSYSRLQEYYEVTGGAFVFLCKETHRIKKKAEQKACKRALDMFS